MPMRALITRRNTMIFSGQKKRPLYMRKKTGQPVEKTQMKKRFINLALMANSDEQEASSSSSQVLTTNITELCKDDCKIIIDDISNELCNLHISLKSLTK